MKPPELLELIKQEIDQRGELHLDKVKTAALAQWITAMEKYSRDIAVQFKLLQDLVEPLRAKRPPESE